MVPAGTFALGDDLRTAHWQSRAYEGIYISHSDFRDFPRAKSSGCCGPSGAAQNVLDSQNMEPVAYEFADCHSCHYIHFGAGDYELTEESPEPPVCLVGCVSLNRQTWLVGAACGHDDWEARVRLNSDCQKYLAHEAGLSSHHRQISMLPVEIVVAAQFLRRFKKTERPQWLFLKY
jgi:hypothetical protein